MHKTMSLNIKELERSPETETETASTSPSPTPRSENGRKEGGSAKPSGEDKVNGARPARSIVYIRYSLEQFLDKPENIEKYVKQRQAGGGSDVDYVPWNDKVRILNQVCNYQWSFSLLGDPVYSPKGDQVTVKGRLIINAAEGAFSFDDFGCEPLEVDYIEPNTQQVVPAGYGFKTDWDKANKVAVPKRGQDGKLILYKKGIGFKAEHKAKAQAFGRCCAQAGLGLQFYDRDEDE